MSIELEISAKGQVTLEPEVMRQLGLVPGDKLVLDLLPSGHVQAKAKSRPTLESVVGMLKQPGQPILTIEELSELDYL